MVITLTCSWNVLSYRVIALLPKLPANALGKVGVDGLSPLRCGTPEQGSGPRASARLREGNQSRPPGQSSGPRTSARLREGNQLTMFSVYATLPFKITNGLKLNDL